LVNDTDKGQPLGFQDVNNEGIIEITKNHTDFETASSTLTTSSGGIMSYNFDPNGNCEYDVGIQKWRMSVEDHSDYKNQSSSNFTVELWSYLQANITSPSGEAFRRNIDNVTIIFNVTDECDHGVGYANQTIIHLYTEQGASYDITSGITDFGNGTYQYDWETTTEETGIYNITIEVYKDYYVGINETKNESFTLGAVPELEYTTSNEYYPSGDGGWGETHTFRARCRDYDNDTLIVNLWKKINQSSEWELLEWQYCNTTKGDYVFQTKTFQITDFTCADVTPANDNTTFKFNVSDQLNFSAETIPRNITIFRDNVSFLYQSGGDADISREGPDSGLFSILVRDSDKSNNPVPDNVSGIFWITTDGSAYDSYLTNKTNSSGVLMYSFDPNCTYRFGEQHWTAGTYQDGCYFDLNQTEYDFTVYGQLKNNILLPPYQDVYNVTDLVPIRVNVTSDCSDEEGSINATYLTVQLQSPYSEWYSCAPTVNETSPNEGYYNCTWDSTDKREGAWSIQLNSSKSYFNSNQTFLQDWFLLENLNATWSNQQVTPATDGWTRLYNYSVDIDDPDSDEINCSLYINKYDGAGWVFKGNHTLYNSSGVNSTCYVTVWDFTGQDIGENTYMFYIQNGEPTNFFNTTNYTGPTLEVSNTSVIFMTQNNTEVNITGDTEFFTVLVNDTDNVTAGTWNPPGINVTFWVTYNSSETDPGNLTQTNQTGYANVEFDPDCSYSVGPRVWWANVTDNYYEMNRTYGNMTITVMGHQNNTIQEPYGQEVQRGSNVTFRFHLQDEDGCGRN
ncbi:MAG: hypothetical protein KAT35_02670, partial [Candidatus Aenigmarchaeota archaeon]|nr:hypothetical protein [Candidatus Aenigmarchaeota archaeon]